MLCNNSIAHNSIVKFVTRSRPASENTNVKLQLVTEKRRITELLKVILGSDITADDVQSFQ